MKISKRLLCLANQVSPSDQVIDVGCDHGQLGTYLIIEKNLKHIIASDIEAMPIQACISTAKKHNVIEKMTIVQASGLQALAQDLFADTAIISGMGGFLIASILEDGPIDTIKKLIMQPNNGAYTLRKWLTNNNFKISNEFLVEDNKIIYEVIVAVPGIQKLTDQEILLGPVLLKEKSELFIKKWQTELDKFEKLLVQIPNDVDRLKIQKRIQHIKAAL